MTSQPHLDIRQFGRALSGSANSSNDLETASKVSLIRSRPVLQVIDAPFDGSTPCTLAKFCVGDDIAAGLNSLPPHHPGTARIIDVTVHSDFLITGLRETKGPKATEAARHALISYLQDTYMQQFQERQIFRWLDDPLLVNDIGGISSQWTQELGNGRQHLYRLVNRATLQQHPLDHDVRPGDSYLTCAQDSNDRLIVIVVNDVHLEQSFSIGKGRHNQLSFENPRMITHMLSGHSWTALSDGSLDTFAKLLVLDFFLASIYLQKVDFYGPLIYPQTSEKKRVKLSVTRNPHLQVPLGLFEPRLSAKSKEAFREIEDAEGILRSVDNLVDSIKFVLVALHPNQITSVQEPDCKYRKSRIQQLEGLCEERRNNAKRALEALNRQLDYLTKRHSIREANSVKRLTILASIYLPLSLAAGMLGMQVSFKEVAHDRTVEEDGIKEWLKGTNLLFDFFGLFIILASITIFILQAIKLGLWLKTHGLGLISKRFNGPFSPFYYGRKWRFDGKGGAWFDFLRMFTAWWIGAAFLITVLALFLFGMLTKAQTSWNAARVAFAIYGSVGGAALLCCVLMYCSLHRKSFQVNKI